MSAPVNQSAMHLEPGSTTVSAAAVAVDKSSVDTSSSSSDSMVTRISLDIANMTIEELARHYELLDNLTQEPAELDILKETNWRISIIAIYSVVILFGFLENLVILLVLLRSRKLHTPTNIFIMGLAISDISMCSFNLPFQLHSQLTDQWVFGSALCHVFIPSYGIPVVVSSMSMFLIAIDRYWLIVHPFKKRMSKRTAALLVLSVAVFTTIIAIPLFMHTEFHVIDMPGLRIYRTYCIERWTDYNFRHIYTVSTIIIQFFVPLIATSLLYLRISDVLANRPLKKNERRRKNKTNKILIAIVLMFSLCWLPWNLFGLILEFNPQLVSGRYIKLLDLLLKIFAMGSACINPFLYGWLNDNFRRGLDTILKRPGRNRIRQNGQTYTLAEYSRTDNNDKCTLAI